MNIRYKTDRKSVWSIIILGYSSPSWRLQALTVETTGDTVGRMNVQTKSECAEVDTDFEIRGLDTRLLPSDGHQR